MSIPILDTPGAGYQGQTAQRGHGTGQAWVADDYQDAQAVTPNDGADLPGGKCRALLVSVAGALKVTTAAGTTITLTATQVPAGVVFPLRCSRVFATGTGATGIVALY